MVILWQGGKKRLTSPGSRRANAIARPLRKLVMPSDEVGYYHVYNRCVRGGFLLAALTANGQSDPRKDWIQTHIKYLCQGFAVEVCDFCLMDSHFHLILRNRPDLVPLYSDEEVVRRWWHIQRRQVGSRLAADPPSLTMRLWMNDPSEMESYRRRLSDISCFMQRFSEHIARRANLEDGQHGKFWEERFRATRLLDDEAVLACSVYVNLNPIRAGVVDRPEESRYTSAFERIQALQSSELGGRTLSEGQLTDANEARIESQLFICRVRLAGRSELVANVLHNAYPALRASDRGYLPLGLLDHVRLLDWTGRQVRRDKAGSIPSTLAPIFDRLQLDADRWVDTVNQMPDLLVSAMGRSENITKEARRTDRQWIKGVRVARDHSS